MRTSIMRLLVMNGIVTWGYILDEAHPGMGMLYRQFHGTPSSHETVLRPLERYLISIRTGWR